MSEIVCFDSKALYFLVVECYFVFEAGDLFVSDRTVSFPHINRVCLVV